MRRIDHLFVGSDATILKALQIIDQGVVQIALVVDEQQHLIGTVTDGDVRRGILKGMSMDSPVETIMNKSPKVSHIYDSREVIFAKMKQFNLKQVPILDDSGKVIQLALIDDMIKSNRKDNWVVLMAGGLGTRLGALTKDCPKPLLKVGSKPILEVIMESFIAHGFHRFYISVNYRADMIMDYFGNGAQWGVEIRYVLEDKRLGTAGALSLLPEQPELPLIVMNGDLLTKVNFTQLLEFHDETSSEATMCVREYEFQVPYGVVKVNNHQLEAIEEKPTQKFFISGGIYVVNSKALQYIPKNEYFDMPSLFERLIEAQCSTSVFPIREYWMDIGRMEEYERANEAVSEGAF